jgi:hypothetical protein
VWIGGHGPAEEPPASVYLRGRLREDPDARVRVSRRGDALAGVVVTGGDVFHLASARSIDAKARPDAVVVSRQADGAAMPGHCGVRHAPVGPAPLGVAEGGRAGATGVRRARIGVVADYEFFQAHGAAAAAVAQDAIVFAGAIFEADLDVAFAIGTTVVFTTVADPFSTTDPNGLLDQFVAYRTSAAAPLAGSDVAHLFTGRDLKGSVVGIAWLGTVCDPRYGTGLSQNLAGGAMARVAAHEIGHNFGAGHDPLRCVDPPDGYLMQPNLGCVGRTGFSARSQNDIAIVVDGATCLDSGAPGTPTPTPSPTRTRPPGTPTSTNTRGPTRTPTPTGPTRTPTATPPFSPARVAGLVLWLDAGQLSGLADGAAVAAWADQRGGPHAAVQAASSAQPVYRAAAVNGRPAIHFDGMDDHLVVAATLASGSQKRSVVLVGRPDALGDRAMIDLGNIATPGAGFLITPEHAVRTGTGERRWTPPASLTAPAVTVVRLNGVSTQYLAAWVNGQRLTVTAITAARVVTAGGTTIGASTAHRAAGPHHFAGDLAEILVYDQGLTEGEREQLEQYLMTKYGIR